MRSFLAWSLILFITACSAPHTLYMYTLSPSLSTPLSPISAYRGASVRVDYPKGIEDTMGTRIYYSRSRLTQSYYLYHQWSRPLNRIIMSNLISTLQQNHTFRHVLDYASEARADYLLESTVYRFRHMIEEKGSYADVSIGLRLLRTSDNHLLKSRRFEYRVPCSSTDAKGFVESANKAMEYMGQDIKKWLRR